MEHSDVQTLRSSFQTIQFLVIIKVIYMRHLRFYFVVFLFVQFQFVFAQTEVEKEIKLGNEYAKMVEAEMGLWDNVGMQAYVNQVGQRLVATLPTQPYPYTFQIVDQWEPNA